VLYYEHEINHITNIPLCLKWKISPIPFV